MVNPLYPGRPDMTNLRTHYIVAGKARCGNTPRNWTIDPTKVTCESCKKLMSQEIK